MRILLVEDDVEELLRTVDFDVACLDLGLPDGDGLDLLRRMADGGDLRRPRRSIVITARDAVQHRVAGLDAGADDYLVKPYAFTELLARIRALGRRDTGGGATVQIGDVVVDTSAHRAWRAGVELTLTARELSLLRYFLHHPGEVLSAEHLLEHVWDAHADPFSTSVRVILSRLRRKLGDPPVIVTVTGAGYRFEAAP
jgi:DNA-binding response OmpR family regulator